MSNLSPRGGSVVNAHFFHKCNSLFQKFKTFKKMHACRISLPTPDQSARALKRRHASTPKTTGQGSIKTQMLVFAAVCACKPQSLNMPRQHDAKKHPGILLLQWLCVIPIIDFASARSSTYPSYQSKRAMKNTMQMLHHIFAYEQIAMLARYQKNVLVHCCLWSWNLNHLGLYLHCLVVKCPRCMPEFLFWSTRPMED